MLMTGDGIRIRTINGQSYYDKPLGFVLARPGRDLDPRTDRRR